MKYVIKLIFLFIISSTLFNNLSISATQAQNVNKKLYKKYKSLAYVCYKLHNYDDAIKYYKKAKEEAYSRIKDEIIRSISDYNLLALILAHSSKDLNEAEKFIKYAITMEILPEYKNYYLITLGFIYYN